MILLLKVAKKKTGGLKSKDGVGAFIIEQIYLALALSQITTIWNVPSITTYKNIYEDEQI